MTLSPELEALRQKAVEAKNDAPWPFAEELRDIGMPDGHAEIVAAASPDVILSLLKQIEELEAASDSWESAATMLLQGASDMAAYARNADPLVRDAITSRYKSSLSGIVEAIRYRLRDHLAGSENWTRAAQSVEGKE